MALIIRSLLTFLAVVQLAAADNWSAPAGWTNKIEGKISFEKPNTIFGNWTDDKLGISVLMFSAPHITSDVDIRDGVSGFVVGLLRSGQYPEAITYVNVKGVTGLKVQGTYVGATAEYWQEAYVFIGKHGSYAVKVAKTSRDTNFNIEDWVIPIGTLPEAENRLKLIQSQLGGEKLKELQDSLEKLQAITRKKREAESTAAK